MNIIRSLSPLLISIGIIVSPLKSQDPEPENKTSEKLFCEDSHKKNLPEQTSSDQTPLKEGVEKQKDQKSDLPSAPEKVPPQPIPSKDSSKKASTLQALLQEAANKQRVPEYAFLKNEGLSTKLYHTILSTANWCQDTQRSLENFSFKARSLLSPIIGLGTGLITYQMLTHREGGVSLSTLHPHEAWKSFLAGLAAYRFIQYF